MPSSYVPNASELLTEGLSFTTWCELCGDEKPGPIEQISSVSFGKYDDKFHTIEINGETIDAAYLYVYSNGNFENLGHLYHCNPEGVYERIYAWTHVMQELRRIKLEEARTSLGAVNR